MLCLCPAWQFWPHPQSLSPRKAWWSWTRLVLVVRRSWVQILTLNMLREAHSYLRRPRESDVVRGENVLAWQLIALPSPSRGCFPRKFGVRECACADTLPCGGQRSKSAISPNRSVRSALSFRVHVCFVGFF